MATKSRTKLRIVGGAKNVSIDFAEVDAVGGQAEGSVDVAGAKVTDVALVSAQTLTTGLTHEAYVNATGVVYVLANNYLASPVTPGAVLFNVVVLRA